jgi:hypothetical protein
MAGGIPTLGFRRQLLAGTTHSTMAAIVERAGGWITIAKGAKILEAEATRR